MRTMRIILALILFVSMFAMPTALAAPEQPELEQPDIIESIEQVESKASPYYIYIEKGSYTLTVYGKDSSGNYTKRIKSYRVAIGRNNRTPSGKFTILGKERWHSFAAGGYAQYASRYSGSLYIHSPVYGSKNIYDMWTNYYNAIGTAATAGCIRTHCAAAYWIYNNCPAGTVVEIVSGSPKGTSSPAAPALNSNNKKYDPTDPNVSQASANASTTASTPTIKWQQSGGNWYLYNSSGTKLTGWQKVALEWYYLGSDGAMRTGWQQISNKWYYFKSGGQMAILWHQVGNSWYYFGSDGEMKTGWIKDDGKWYLLDSGGKMLASQAVTQNGKTYVLDQNGIMQTSKWALAGGKWYNLNASGVAATGWLKGGGKWYLLGGDGAMITGWTEVKGSRYYLNPSTGEMVTGWKRIGDAWYLFNDNGVMHTGWADRGDKRYYFAEDGKMATGQVELDGVIYNFNAEGELVNQQ